MVNFYWRGDPLGSYWTIGVSKFKEGFSVCHNCFGRGKETDYKGPSSPSIVYHSSSQYSLCLTHFLHRSNHKYLHQTRFHRTLTYFFAFHQSLIKWYILELCWDFVPSGLKTNLVRWTLCTSNQNFRAARQIHHLNYDCQIPDLLFELLQHEREEGLYLHASLMARIDAPLLPITRPIFPGGTSSTDRISSSGHWFSDLRLSATLKSPIRISKLIEANFICLFSFLSL